MKCTRGYLPLAVLMFAAVFAGCKSNQATNQTAQAATGSTATPASQPGATSGTASPATPVAPPPPAAVDLPGDTHLRVRLDEDLGSKISQPGDAFHATIADDVVLDGQTVIAKGARAEGTVVDAQPLGKFKGGALLELRLERVTTNWGSYPVATSSIERAEKGKGKRSAAFIGGGTAFGAIVGGLAGGGKGAAIGALAGGGAGTAGGALTGNKQIFLPAETLLTFRLEHPVHIVEQQ